MMSILGNLISDLLVVDINQIMGFTIVMPVTVSDAFVNGTDPIL